ncbi:MAG: hypothetical protein KAI43_01515 [Candidatus Aureabacteria bacterium]|nr:hypothetical protein [Candidatus Auribacterota bacterium]
MKAAKEFFLIFILVLLFSFFCITNNNQSVLFADELKVNFIYTSSGFRDPFVPSSYQSTEEVIEEDDDDFLSRQNIKLEGIIWDPTDPYAIINDKILRTGDEFDGITIIKIEKERVTFEYKDKTIVKPLIGKGE